MPLQGDIKTFSVSAVSRMIHAENKTGTLRISSDQGAASIHFKNGGIVFVGGDQATDLALGSLLANRNIISQEDIRKAKETAQATGRPLEAVLLEQGHTPPDKLVNVLRHHFKEVLANVLTWENGAFQYSDGLGGNFGNMQPTIDPIRLIAEARKWKEFRSLIPSDDVVFKITDRKFKPDPLAGDSVSRVMLLINGQRSVARIIKETGLTRMAVYRVLASMASQGAISRDVKIGKETDPGQPRPVVVIKLYLSLLNEMISSLNLELGSKKAAFLLEKSLKDTPCYQQLFSAFRPDSEPATNLSLIQNHIQQQKPGVLSRDLISGFNLAVCNLFQEEYQLLGFRACINTVMRAQTLLEKVSPDQQILARTLSRFINQLSADEDLLRGTKSLADTMGSDLGMPVQESPLPPHRPHIVPTTTIIAFYSIVIQMLMQDLEQEVGAKALGMLQDAMTASEYYDIFLSQFDINASIESNVDRINRHIGSRGNALDKQDILLAFQGLFNHLLHVENQLLGNKAVRMSLLKIKDQAYALTDQNYKRLADRLLASLKNIDRETS